MPEGRSFDGEAADGVVDWFVDWAQVHNLVRTAGCSPRVYGGEPAMCSW